MKVFKSLGYITLIMGLFFLYNSNVDGASGNKCKYFSITSTGTQAVTFDFSSTEIYVMKVSTMDCYISFVSSQCDSTQDSDLYLRTEAMNIREEIESYYLSVFSTDPSINIEGWYKGEGTHAN